MLIVVKMNDSDKFHISFINLDELWPNEKYGRQF